MDLTITDRYFTEVPTQNIGIFKLGANITIVKTIKSELYRVSNPIFTAIRVCLKNGAPLHPLDDHNFLNFQIAYLEVSPFSDTPTQDLPALYVNTHVYAMIFQQNS